MNMQSLIERPAARYRGWTNSQRMIAILTTLFALFVAWASIAQVDEVTRGQGEVIPSSKVQLIQASEPATVAELMVRSGQRVSKGQLLARLDNPQSRQVQAETDALEARAQRLQSEGTGEATSFWPKPPDSLPGNSVAVASIRASSS